ncbi:hypothetical protein HK101_008609 [Irineochytrium annulatum]|nr:hypothetical protein HK101_008609 [Irineochytrium annulatum]
MSKPDGTAAETSRKLQYSRLSSPELDKIDRVRQLGVNDLISLPQIAVCGDQSSGKSSLLEFISGIPLPKGDGMCTTFATQIVMAPADEFSCKVQHPVLTPAESNRTLRRIAAIHDLIVKVRQRVGSEKITSDVMTIDLRGPGYPRLTLVDLPGYVHSSVEGQADNISQVIEGVVQPYIANERTINLAVFAANRDLQTNFVLKKINDHDKTGSRTLGVFTKPDMADSGNRDQVIGALNGGLRPLDLGYHVVLNGKLDADSAADSDSDDSDCGDNGAEREHARLSAQLELLEQQEDIHLSSSPWDRVARHHRGIAALRNRLVGLLGEHVTRELPKVRRQLWDDLAARKKELTLLGASMDDPAARERSRVGSVMEVRRRWDMAADGKAVEDAKEEELTDEQLSDLIDVHRGRGPAAFPSYVTFAKCVNEVVKGWEEPTMSYVDKAVALCSNVLSYLIDSLMPDLFKTCMQEEARALVKDWRDMNRKEVQELLADEVHPHTHNNYFTEQARARMEEDVRNRLGKQVQDDIHLQYTGSRVHAIVKELHGHESQGAYEVKLMRAYVDSYCRTAYKRFVDYICLHVFERIVFRKGSKRMVDRLMTVDISACKESYTTAVKRDRLEDDIKRMEAALKEL